MILTEEEEKRLQEEGTWDAYWRLRENDRKRERAFWSAWQSKWNKETPQWP